MTIRDTILGGIIERRWAGRPELGAVMDALQVAMDAMGADFRREGTNIDMAFTWARSPQGSAYWAMVNDIDYALRRGERVPEARKPPPPPPEKKYAAIYK